MPTEQAPGERVMRAAAPHFVAACVLQDAVCIDAAPILYRLTIGQTYAEIRRRIAARGWTIEDNPEDVRS
jgi:hypothetical protein